MVSYISFKKKKKKGRKKNPCILAREVTFDSFMNVLCNEALNSMMTLTRSLSYARTEPSLGKYSGVPDQCSFCWTALLRLWKHRLDGRDVSKATFVF